MSGFSSRRIHTMVRLLVSSPIWVTGFLVCLVALGFQVAAFVLVPLLVAQTIYAGGLVLLVAASRVFVGESLNRRELVALGTIVVAVLLVSASVRAHEVNNLPVSSWRVVITAAVTSIVAFVIMAKSARNSNSPGVLYGVVAGLLYGAGTLGTKGAAVLVGRGSKSLSLVPHLLASPYPYLFFICAFLGLVVYQFGIQRHRISIVGPIQSVVSSIYVVIAGAIVFNQGLPNSGIYAALEVVGFASMLIGTFSLTRSGGSPTSTSGRIAKIEADPTNS